MKMKAGGLEVDSDELAEFIIESKKKGYAGGGEYKKASDGSKVFTFQKGNFHYEDRFWGSIQAPGIELVRWQNENGPGLWFMSYSGGMLLEFWKDEELTRKTFEFLKEALMHATPIRPLRGPRGYENKTGEFLYLCETPQDISRFSGKEEIIFGRFDKIVFSQDFIGGLIESR